MGKSGNPQPVIPFLRQDIADETICDLHYVCKRCGFNLSRSRLWTGFKSQTISYLPCGEGKTP